MPLLEVGGAFRSRWKRGDDAAAPARRGAKRPLKLYRLASQSEREDPARAAVVADSAAPGGFATNSGSDRSDACASSWKRSTTTRGRRCGGGVAMAGSLKPQPPGSRKRFSAIALTATMMLDADMLSAATAGLRVNPWGSRA